MIGVFVLALAPTVRAGLRAMLGTFGLRIVGEGSALAASGSGLEDADVVVTTGEGWLDSLPLLPTDLSVVALSDDERVPSILSALRLPGWAVLPEDATAEQLEAAVVAAARGLSVVTAVRGADLARPRDASGSQLTAEAIQEPLTAREREVLELLSQGLSNKLIAKRLNISEHTVKFHVSSTFAKLGASSRTEAMSLAARRGLIAL